MVVGLYVNNSAYNLLTAKGLPFLCVLISNLLQPMPPQALAHEHYRVPPAELYEEREKEGAVHGFTGRC